MLNRLLSPTWISLSTAVTATVITFVLGVIAAWWMSRYQGKTKGVIEAILTAPLVLPPTVVGFLLLLTLGKNGFLGQLLDAVGIRLVFTWYATVIAATVVAFPLMYKSALTAFEQIDNNLIDCAKTLGASEQTIFWRVVLPLARSGLLAGTLLAFARALGEFGATLMLAGSIPGKTQTIPIAIYLAAESGAMDLALGLVIILLAITLGVMIAINYQDRQKIKISRLTKRYRSNKVGQRLSRSEDRDEPINQDRHQSTINLEVNIQKQLPDLLLDIAFKINYQQNPLGILGASGSGKTTLLRCIAGLTTPDRGIIRLNNRTLFDSAKGINLSPQEREVGLIWQDYALFPHLTVGENIAFGMDRKLTNSVVNQEIEMQLQQLNLTSLKDRFPNKLSGGEQQRVALARALASKPQIALLDEPLSALDTDLKSKLLQLLKTRLNNYSGLSLYVTHNLKEADAFCPQLLVIDRGKAIAFDTKQAVFNHPPNLKTAQIVGCNNFSPAKAINSQSLRVSAWQCNLKVTQAIPRTLSLIGIHAHRISFVPNKQGINIFPVWLAIHNELSDRVILYLKLHSPAEEAQDYHLMTEVSWSKWDKLQQLPTPWYIQIPANQIIMF